MAKDEKTFAELVKDAPKAASEDTVTLVGTLAKHTDPKRFVLYMSDGSSHDFEIAAVKRHTLLGQSVGNTVVQVEIDREAVPERLHPGSMPNTVPAIDTQHTPIYADSTVAAIDNTLPAADHIFTVPSFDWTTPILDRPQTIPVVDIKLPIRDNPATYVGGDEPGTIQENIGDPFGGGGGDPAFGALGRVAAPFSLMAQHQVAPQQVEALNAMSFGGTRTYLNGYNWMLDHHYIPRVAY